jgi:putative GTP pyrophosphokinase
MEEDNNKNSVLLNKGILTQAEKKTIEDLLKHDFIQEFVQDLKMFNLKYIAAKDETETRLKILNEDFKTRYNRSPIDHIESRIKTPESLIRKMLRKNVPISIDSIEGNIFDIAGIRVVCMFLSDVELIVEMIKNNPEFEILNEKDYISHPKASGYRSYHIIVKVPVYLTTGKELVVVEIQIRTLAQDYYSKAEYMIKYKFDGVVPNEVQENLLDCANAIAESDLKMMSLHDKVLEANKT